MKIEIPAEPQDYRRPPKEAAWRFQDMSGDPLVRFIGDSEQRFEVIETERGTAAPFARSSLYDLLKLVEKNGTPCFMQHCWR